MCNRLQRRRRFLFETGINYGPTFTEPLTVTPNPVTGATAILSTNGIESDQETPAQALAGDPVPTFTFENILAPMGAGSASLGAGPAIGTAEVTFTQLGSYTFTAEINGGTTETTAVTVVQTETNITVSPAPIAPDPDVEASSGQQIQFSATATDQFGNAMVVEPIFTYTLGR